MRHLSSLSLSLSLSVLSLLHRWPSERVSRAKARQVIACDKWGGNCIAGGATWPDVHEDRFEKLSIKELQSCLGESPRSGFGAGAGRILCVTFTVLKKDYVNTPYHSFMHDTLFHCDPTKSKVSCPLPWREVEVNLYCFHLTNFPARTQQSHTKP